MKLKEFIEKFVCKNTLIRLWIPTHGCSGHTMLSGNGKDVGMEWEILKGETWQSKLLGCEVVGVTDILNDSYVEAVNIVINL